MPSGHVEVSVLLCVISVLCNCLIKVEGVGSDGRMYLLQRPSNAEVQNQLWALYLASEGEKNEMKARLNFKVSVVLGVVLSVFDVMCCVRLSS